MLPYLYHCLLSSIAAPLIEEPELPEEVANIGKDVAEEAAKIDAAKEQEHAAGGVQELWKETEKTLGSTPGSRVLIEEKPPPPNHKPPSLFWHLGGDPAASFEPTGVGPCAAWTWSPRFISGDERRAR